MDIQRMYFRVTRSVDGFYNEKGNSFDHVVIMCPVDIDSQEYKTLLPILQGIYDDHVELEVLAPLPRRSGIKNAVAIALDKAGKSRKKK